MKIDNRKDIEAENAAEAADPLADRPNGKQIAENRFFAEQSDCVDDGGDVYNMNIYDMGY